MGGGCAATCADGAVNVWTQLPPAVKHRVVGDAGDCGRSGTVVLVGALQLPPYLDLRQTSKLTFEYETF